MSQVIAERVRAAREKLGITKREAARRAGVHQNTYMNVEAGKGFHYDTLGQIAKALGTDVAALTQGDTEN
jgi:transcriptional regulator with XRE-family HTH domain